MLLLYFLAFSLHRFWQWYLAALIRCYKGVRLLLQPCAFDAAAVCVLGFRPSSMNMACICVLNLQKCVLLYTLHLFLSYQDLNIFNVSGECLGS